MFRQTQTLILALLTALLIILGGVGIFIAEASSLRGIMVEAQNYDPSTPLDAYRFNGTAPDEENSSFTFGFP
ncbi:MAG: hypothetical protein IT306_02120 [Chloroflexi bacterium]|nr:hypothetical protein [Chloroflexota bacterium]